MAPNMNKKLSNAKLDELTIKVSTLLHDAGIDVKYNEDNNFIRGCLVKLFTTWVGLDIEVDAASRYTDWKQVRNKLHIPDPFK